MEHVSGFIVTYGLTVYHCLLHLATDFSLSQCDKLLLARGHLMRLAASMLLEGLSKDLYY